MNLKYSNMKHLSHGLVSELAVQRMNPKHKVMQYTAVRIVSKSAPGMDGPV